VYDSVVDEIRSGLIEVLDALLMIFGMSKASIHSKDWNSLWEKQKAYISKQGVNQHRRIKRRKHTIPEFQIDNVVSTFRLNHRLDLMKLSMSIPFLEYNPSKFTAATMRLVTPRSTALTFASGAVVCTGAKSVVESIDAANIYTSIIKKACSPIQIHMETGTKVQNIVASARCGFAIDLYGIAAMFDVRTSFEMSLFPGLVFRIDQPKVVFLVFRSGSIVITGSNSIETIETIFAQFYSNILLQYKDTGSTSLITNSAEYEQLIHHERIHTGNVQV
tara:strand:+ start:313 stop:1140 length:828 start_codon:yes stop_codon:yes gene_type:complete